MRLIAVSGLLLGAIGASTCGNAEDEFFEGDIATRNQRLANYPLEQQWEIFRYGNQDRHPPATGLAVPIARQGKPALDFILKWLEDRATDLDFRDSLVVFQTMQWGGYYDLCGDAFALQRIQANALLIRNRDWRKIYNEMLQKLCQASTDAPILQQGEPPT